MRTAFVLFRRILPIAVLVPTLLGCGGSSGHGGLGFASTDASLSALTSSVGSLSPVFSPTTTGYTVAVGSIVPSVTVTPTATDAGATIRVNGVPVTSATASGPIVLAPNPTPTPVTVTVTAQDAVTTRTYTLIYVRAASPSQEAYIKASNTGSGDAFGVHLSISTDTLVVGAPNEDSSATGVGGNQADNSATDSGAVYVFLRTGTTWTQQAYLKASNSGGGDLFGSSVAVSTDTIVIGARLEASNATGVNGLQTDNTTAGAGAAYVFVRSAGVWTQQAYLKASNTEAQDQFGIAVSISADTIVVGALNEDSSATGINGLGSDNSLANAGAAYVFFRVGTTWTQQAYLKASNTGAGDLFGTDVSISMDTIVVGSPQEDSNAVGIGGNQADNSFAGSGAAYAFVRSGTVWTQQAYIKASNTGTLDVFGTAVAVTADTIVVGAPGEASNAVGVGGNQADNSALGSGAAYAFVRTGVVWAQQVYLKASNTDVSDAFGSSVAISVDTIIVGSPLEDSNAVGIGGNQADNTLNSAGAAYLFVRSGTVWTQQNYLKASNSGGQDRFGGSVGVFGDTSAIGTDGEDSNAVGVGGTQIDNSATDAGAAYVFRS